VSAESVTAFKLAASRAASLTKQQLVHATTCRCGLSGHPVTAHYKPEGLSRYHSKSWYAPTWMSESSRSDSVRPTSLP